MDLTFLCFLARRNELLHSQAIWQEILDHLQRFLDTDASPAKMGIATKGEGMTVPQTEIEKVIVEISKGRMADISDELETISTQKVADHVRKKDETRTKAEPTKESRGHKSSKLRAKKSDPSWT